MITKEYRKEWKSRKRARISRNEALKIAEKYGDEKLRKVAEAPFLYLRVKSIKKVKSTSGYAYDLTVPGYENFVGGRGGIFLHNTKFDRGLGTDVGQRQDLYKLSGKEKNKFFRLRKWQYRISTAIERNLKLALAELKQTTFTESGYKVYVVGTESLPVLLAMLKRVDAYGLTDKIIDSAERESIVTVLADMHQHINFRNAADLQMTKFGLDALRRVGLRLKPEMQDEVGHLLGKSRLPVMSSSEIKKLMANPDNQETVIVAMTSPKAIIPKEDMEAVSDILTSSEIIEAHAIEVE